jgi:DNA-binding response OmpR family regulator
LRVTNQEILRFWGRKAITKSKILIVDDDPDLRQSLKLRLRANHYDTVHAVDGLSGLTLAYKELPNLIILDLGLPAGDGFAVLDYLRRDDRLFSIPVIVLTARDPQSSEQRSLAAGAAAFFQKPADNTELLEMIRATLTRPVLQRPSPSWVVRCRRCIGMDFKTTLECCVVGCGQECPGSMNEPSFLSAAQWDRHERLAVN